MSYQIPTRQEAIQITRDLIDGKRESIEVGLWAAELDKPENQALDTELRRADPKLREFLDTLSLAPQKGNGDELLYGKEDSQDWLDEFLRVQVKIKSYLQHLEGWF